MYISSKQNTRYKQWKKLLTKKGRREQRRFLIEGEHLVEEALQSPYTIEEIIFSEGYAKQEEWLNANPQIHNHSYTLPVSLFEELAETQAPQGIAMVVTMPEKSCQAVEWQAGTFILLIDRVQDPGNLGTILRTADAAGVDAVCVNKGTVDLFAGKVLRSSQGSIFHLPLYEVDLPTLIPQARQEGWFIAGTSLHGAKDYRHVRLEQEQKIALLVGNEGEGVQQHLQSLVDVNVKIPIWGKAESLNVAIATGILIYHIQGSKQY